MLAEHPRKGQVTTSELEKASDDGRDPGALRGRGWAQRKADMAVNKRSQSDNLPSWRRPTCRLGSRCFWPSMTRRPLVWSLQAGVLSWSVR